MFKVQARTVRQFHVVCQGLKEKTMVLSRLKIRGYSCAKENKVTVNRDKESMTVVTALCTPWMRKHCWRKKEDEKSWRRCKMIETEIIVRGRKNADSVRNSR